MKIRASQAHRSAAGLGISCDETLLLARTSYDGTGRVIEFGETAYRGDRYRFRATLVRVRQSRGRNVQMNGIRAMRRGARTPLVIVIALVAGLALSAGFARGSSTATTLVVQDGEGSNLARGKALNQFDRLFEKSHPGVTIKRIAKSFGDLTKIDALQFSGSNPPDVSEVNQGLSDMGQLVKAGLLVPLDAYAAKWGWGKRQSASLLAIDGRATSSGQIGRGKLYGISTTGDWVGVFYNKVKLAKLGIALPKTLAEFEKALATAKSSGETPIMFGNLNKWPGIHEFQSVLMAIAPKGQVGNTVFGVPGSKWSTPAALQAAATLQKWVKQGYFVEGFSGLTSDDAAVRFRKGEGVFLITGTWKTGDMVSSLGKDVGLMLLPSARANQAPGAVAAGGLAWAIPAKAKNRELGAEYINFITSAPVAKVILAAGDVPAIVQTGKVPAGVSGDAVTGWRKLNQANSMAGYMDWATPTFYDTITAAIQDLLGEKITAQEFVKKLDADYLKFHKKSA